MSVGWAERLYLFLKPPRIGRAKTRLAAGISGPAAACFYRNSVSGLYGRLGADARWETRAAVDGRAEGFPADWPAAGAVPQGGGDLGDRLRRLLRMAPPGPMVVIGTDAPQIAPAQIAKAFRALRGADLVLGPAADGGYWLIGLRRMRSDRDFLKGVRWSTEHALADTRASAPETWRVVLLETLEDVDDAESFARVSRLRSQPAAGTALV
ncbi:MAG: DUF2064 domain-containing protein [Pseudomonadota bacterium]